MRIGIHHVAAIVTLAVVAGCGSSPSSPSHPSVDLTGTWSGTLGQGSEGGRALRVTWVATQTGSDVTGAASVLTSPPTTDVLFSGTLAGSVSGGTVSLTLSAHPQQGTPDCNLSGSGSAIAAAGTVSGSLQVMFASCGALEPPANSQLTLTRQ
jgi:hypothetical protein